MVVCIIAGGTALVSGQPAETPQGEPRGARPLGPPSVQAVPIPAAADVSIDTGGGNWGRSITLFVAFDNTPPSPDFISYALLRFDVASALPVGVIIDSAVLKMHLYAISNTTTLLPVDISAYLVRSSWDEYTVTWDTQPSLWPWFVATSVASTGWKSWDVTTWARDWYANPAQNYGVAIQGPRPSEPNTLYILHFSSREHGGGVAYLDVTYHYITICDIVGEIPRAECDALVDLYNSTNGPSWTHNTGWLSTYTPCTTPWYGVTCSGGHVTELNLNSNHLVGSIPSTLSNLSSLQDLGLSTNQLTGSIPASLGSLSSLKFLNLSGNQLTDGIPTSLGSLSNLEGLWLSANQLTGSIPSSLGSLPHLTDLSLKTNQLTGSIPASLGSLPNLQRLVLNDNQLTGNIPSTIGNVSTLTGLFVDSNPLSGALPASLTNLDLIAFHFNDTGLCEPPDAAFQAWLASIPSLQRTDVKCGAATATPTPTPTSEPGAKMHLPIIMKQHVVPGPTPTPTPTSTPSPIFSDDFEDGLLTGWTANQGVWTNPGTYMRGQDTEPPAYEIRNVKSATGAAFTYEGTVTLVSGYTVGLIFRCSADGTLGYEVGLSAVDNQFKLGVLAPNYGLLAQTPVTVQYGRAYRIKVVANGSLIEVYLDGVKLLSATDTHYSSGQFGVIVRGGSYAYQGTANFDDLEARALP